MKNIATIEFIYESIVGVFGISIIKALMLTSLIVGVLLTVIYRPRTWCVFCPMGNMTQLICKLKAR